jgi:hypothetical protein
MGSPAVIRRRGRAIRNYGPTRLQTGRFYLVLEFTTGKRGGYRARHAVCMPAEDDPTLRCLRVCCAEAFSSRRPRRAPCGKRALTFSGFIVASAVLLADNFLPALVVALVLDGREIAPIYVEGESLTAPSRIEGDRHVNARRRSRLSRLREARRAPRRCLVSSALHAVRRAGRRSCRPCRLRYSYSSSYEPGCSRHDG